MKDLGVIRHFTGLEINQDLKKKNILTISQERILTKILKRFNMFENKPVSTPMEHNIKMATLKSEENCGNPCNQLLGCLMYAMIAS